MQGEKTSLATVSFGKYRGKPVEVLRDDPSYVNWLTNQAWFRERHPTLFQVIVNNFGEPSETPEHNRLQTRFLDRDFRIAALGPCGVWWAADPRPLIAHEVETTRQRLNYVEKWRRK